MRGSRPSARKRREQAAARQLRGVAVKHRPLFDMLQGMPVSLPACSSVYRLYFSLLPASSVSCDGERLRRVTCAACRVPQSDLACRPRAVARLQARAWNARDTAIHTDDPSRTARTVELGLLHALCRLYACNEILVRCIRPRRPPVWKCRSGEQFLDDYSP